jgi:hypothetical protein
LFLFFEDKAGGDELVFLFVLEELLDLLVADRALLETPSVLDPFLEARGVEEVPAEELHQDVADVVARETK